MFGGFGFVIVDFHCGLNQLSSENLQAFECSAYENKEIAFLSSSKHC